VRSLPVYPFAHLDARRREMEARGIPIIDLGIGDPAEATPGFIREALVAGIPERAGYPRVAGIPALRQSAAGWLTRRFSVTVDPDRELLPINGSKEAIHSLPLAVIDPATRPLALVPEPGYPVYALGVQAAGGEVVSLPLREENGFLPDLASIPEAVWRRTALLWLNYPNNPTGGTARLEFFAEAAARCREHGVLLASDEAYVEIYFDLPPPSALQVGTENVVAIHTLSKRSAMAGYRSGFLAGDARLIEILGRMRPGLGVATPVFVQEAARAAWGDDAHVGLQRNAYRARRDRAVTVLRKAGFTPTAPPATFFLWLPVPGGASSEAFAERCLEAGVVVLPGSALGPGGKGFVRISLTADLSTLDEALARLSRLSV
jgi:acetylornithine aminotransferase